MYFSQSPEEIERLTVDENLSEMDRACLLISTGQDVQKVCVVDHLPQLLSTNQMDALCRVVPKLSVSIREINKHKAITHTHTHMHMHTHTQRIVMHTYTLTHTHTQQIVMLTHTHSHTHTQDLLPAASLEIQESASKSFAIVIEQELVPIHIYVTACLPTVLKQLENRDSSKSVLTRASWH